MVPQRDFLRLISSTSPLLQLPEEVSISKDARSAIGKAASIFVLYATSCANKYAEQDGKDQVSAQNILQAASHLGFDEFANDLKRLYQENKREKEKANEKRRERRKQQKQSRESTEDMTNGQEEEVSGEDNEEDDED
jgi:DNA polymerase epsilon subunit 3